MEKRQNDIIEIDKKYLIQAWQILEELRISLDKIGGHFYDNPEKMRLELDKYISPGVWKKISNASFALASYIPDKEQEKLIERFNYYDK